MRGSGSGNICYRGSSVTTLEGFGKSRRRDYVLEERFTNAPRLRYLCILPILSSLKAKSPFCWSHQRHQKLNTHPRFFGSHATETDWRPKSNKDYWGLMLKHKGSSTVGGGSGLGFLLVWRGTLLPSLTHLPQHVTWCFQGPTWAGLLFLHTTYSSRLWGCDFSTASPRRSCSSPTGLCWTHVQGGKVPHRTAGASVVRD